MHTHTILRFYLQILDEMVLISKEIVLSDFLSILSIAVSILGGILNEKYVLSSRVRCGRNIRNYSLPPHCTKKERKDVEYIVSSALENLEGIKRELSEF